MQGRWHFVRKILIFSTICAFALFTQPQVHAQLFAYVANSSDNTVSVIDTSTNAVVDTVAVRESLGGVVFHPAGTFVYVTNAEDNTVSVIDTATPSQ